METFQRERNRERWCDIKCELRTKESAGERSRVEERDSESEVSEARKFVNSRNNLAIIFVFNLGQQSIVQSQFDYTISIICPKFIKNNLWTCILGNNMITTIIWENILCQTSTKSWSNSLISWPNVFNEWCWLFRTCIFVEHSVCFILWMWLGLYIWQKNMAG